MFNSYIYFKILVLFLIICIYVSVSVWIYVCVLMCSRSPLEGATSHEADIMGGCELPVCVLGTKFGSSEREIWLLNQWTVSLVLIPLFLIHICFLSSYFIIFDFFVFQKILFFQLFVPHVYLVYCSVLHMNSVNASV